MIWKLETAITRRACICSASAFFHFIVSWCGNSRWRSPSIVEINHWALHAFLMQRKSMNRYLVSAVVLILLTFVSADETSYSYSKRKCFQRLFRMIGIWGLADDLVHFHHFTKSTWGFATAVAQQLCKGRPTVMQKSSKSYATVVQQSCQSRPEGMQRSFISYAKVIKQLCKSRPMSFCLYHDGVLLSLAPLTRMR